ncbi:hypothetical protein [Flavobacterium subsaxonicum]|uniref:Uncharacterized protein n=1 Tax=Flavobacterium subsaxonicum WB 4.1-42 = DSM 21790 TaxID=1121898 RepID=A0A0A2MMC6_9FLAO|nr:hypothetical protein [Flavobacterium subsaxonicum]KGO92706.1 hypothetical protein Q766_11345 [Flavobacterium subsaxonicum WB 4.1-42 = DSM 21790]
MDNHANQSNEIDLSYVSQKIKKSLSKVNDSFFDAILFVKRYIIVIVIVIAVGVTLGTLKDENQTYDQKVFVTPNFKSVDYLYGQIQQLNSKIRAHDTEFLNKIGLKSPEMIAGLDLEPIVDIYEFIDEVDNEKVASRKFDLFKLIAENGEMEKMLEEQTTSKNYNNQVIVITTRGIVTKQDVVDPILNYLNSDAYYKQIQAEYIKNLDVEITANDTLIKQIDGILNSFSNRKNGGNNMVSFNNDGQLNDVIETKNKLVAQQALNNIKKVNYTSIVKEKGTVLNFKRKGITNGNNKIIYPVVLLLLFVFVMLFISYYKSQVRKRKALAQNI